MSSSGFDLKKVLQTIAESSVRLCKADNASVILRDAVTAFETLGSAGRFEIGFDEYERYYAGRTFQPGKGSLTGRGLLARKTVQIEDMSTDPEYDPSSAPTMIPQTLLGVPIMRDGDVAGLIIVRRYHVALFNAREIEILETFSRQAAIAIENVRLFNETKEALDQQTALGNVLQSMSRSVFDLDTVLTTLVEQAARLCDAEKGSIHRYEGEGYRTAAFGGANITAEYKQVALDTVRRPGRDTLIGRAALERDVVHIPDVLADPEYKAGDVQRVGGYRTALAVPLLREGFPIGVFVLMRPAVRPFTARQIELVRTFADQAVIAIENVRLFNETTEALEHQTATSAILSVISGSPTRKP